MTAHGAVCCPQPVNGPSPKTSGSILLLGSKLFFPTNTGLFLNIGSGSGTVTDTLSGVAQPDRDVTIGQVGLGVRQYIGDSIALPLRLDSESMEMKQTGGTMKDSKAIALLGGSGVIADVVGLTRARHRRA